MGTKNNSGTIVHVPAKVISRRIKTTMLSELLKTLTTATLTGFNFEDGQDSISDFRKHLDPCYKLIINILEQTGEIPDDCFTPNLTHDNKLTPNMFQNA